TDEFCSSFLPLSKPTNENDWLANYNEHGQTYEKFLKECPFVHSKFFNAKPFDEKTIYLTIFGKIDENIFDIESLVDYTKIFFGVSVKLISLFSNVEWDDKKRVWSCTMDKNKNSINLHTRYNKSTHHSQICVTSILKLLKRVVPKDARCLVALTMYDLYLDDSDLFIAGLAEGNSHIAAFSFFRYDPCLTFNDSDWFYFKKKSVEETIRREQLRLRSCRLLTHEINHLFGIGHCIYWSCLMNGSGHLEEDFSQPMFLCPVDLRKLVTLTKFNIKKRYEELLEFFTKHNHLDEVKMLEIKLNILKKLDDNNRKRSIVDDDEKIIVKRLRRK
ncbi:unnamed protein product, partial [Didymodactylos carnosus]